MIFTRLLILFLVLAAFSLSAQGYDYFQVLPDKPLAPKDNPVTSEKALLGKTMFFDTRLSFYGDVSCNSCHNLAAGGDDDGGAVNMPGRHIKRSVPSVWNVGYMSTYYWDARKPTLESQLVDHIVDPNIMQFSTTQNLVSRLSVVPGYQPLFEKAFGKGKITIAKIAQAISSFERTLIVPNSRFDQFMRGNKAALNDKEKRGMHLFKEKGCLSCHFGTNFAGPAPGPALKMGDGFYELFPTSRGSYYEEKYNLLADKGRFAVTLDEGDRLMWRVPSLRNIVNTAPYFHNGSVSDLHQAVRIMADVQFKNYDVSDKGVDDIVAFLKTLTGQYPQITLPEIPDTPGLSLIPKKAQNEK